MNKNIICVYQDCPLCGDKGRKLKQIIDSKGIPMRKVSFATAEGQELIARAVYDHKIGKMPFFTDGVRFSTDITELFDTPKPTPKPKKTKKPAKRTSSRSRRSKKEVKYESD